MLKRSAGCLLNISSLPGPFAVGVAGDEGVAFARRLAAAGFSWWQLLPLTPLDGGNSPYAGDSAFAGNLLYIDPRFLARQGLISEAEVAACFAPEAAFVADYHRQRQLWHDLLRLAYGRFDLRDADFAAFKRDQDFWLQPYVAFKATAEPQREFYRFCQYIFFSQWRQFKAAVNREGVKLIGDMPFYLALNSADVKAYPQYFLLDAQGAPQGLSGAPPDRFAPQGQLWGNPLYDWQALKKDDYRWFVARVCHNAALFDALRLDHFCGFARFFAVSPQGGSAERGVWRYGPGAGLLRRIVQALPAYPLIAEDLGAAAPAARELMADFALPGMRVLQFGFDGAAAKEHLPHNYPVNCLAYSGTHDNNTLLGWLFDCQAQQRQQVLDYCGFSGNWQQGGSDSAVLRALIRCLWQSPAALTVLPLQDMAGYGCDTRMNIPGSAAGNWGFRATAAAIEQIDWQFFARLNQTFDRIRSIND